MAPLPNGVDDVDAPKGALGVAVAPKFPNGAAVLVFPKNAVGAGCWEFPDAPAGVVPNGEAPVAPVLPNGEGTAIFDVPNGEGAAVP